MGQKSAWLKESGLHLQSDAALWVENITDREFIISCVYDGNDYNRTEGCTSDSTEYLTRCFAVHFRECLVAPLLKDATRAKIPTAKIALRLYRTLRALPKETCAAHLYVADGAIHSACTPDTRVVVTNTQTPYSPTLLSPPPERSYKIQPYDRFVVAATCGLWRAMQVKTLARMIHDAHDAADAIAIVQEAFAHQRPKNPCAIIIVDLAQK